MAVRKALLGLASAALLSGCGSALLPCEEAIEDWEPIYCYRTIGDVTCYALPVPGEERRLVNFYGPPPGSYDEEDLREAIAGDEAEE
jgi:hypothetical protein